MIKLLLIIFSCSMLLQKAAASPDTTIIYLKKNGQVLKTKDSADYFRMILSPDDAVDKDLYRVFDFYPNGKRKMVATSLTGTNNLVLDGACISYFPNGKRQSAIIFNKGLPKGDINRYYPNGNLYVTFTLETYLPYFDYYVLGPTINSTFPNIKIKILECRDSTGKTLAINGTGHVIAYDDDFKNVLAEGNIRNGRKDGDWRGPIADTGRFVITYHKGDFKSGRSYLKSGQQYTFKQVKTYPVFSDGRDDFLLFIKRNTVYLESARQRKIRGNVIVDFYVEINGTISDVTVRKPGLTESLNQEALRVIKLSPLWIPGTIYGITKRMPASASVSFYPN